MNKFLSILLIIILTSFAVYSQEKVELKKADKLTGKTENGETIREVTGNVHFVQGNINVYCNTAIQYVEANRVELIGNVRIFQDTLSLFTDRGVYFGNEQKAVCNSGITLKDPNATLRANKGIYTFADTKAFFTGDVIIVNPTYRITSDELTYYRNTEDSYTKGNVVVTTDSMLVKAGVLNYLRRQGITFAYDNASVLKDSVYITADTLRDFAFERKSIASGRVMLNDLRSKGIVKGDYLENYSEKKYAYVKGNSELIKPEENSKDTLFVYSEILESFREEPEYYIASDSVNIIKGEFLSKSGIAKFSKGIKDSLDIFALSKRPVVWQNNMQMTADSIYAIIKNNKIQTVYAIKIWGLQKSEFSFLINQSDSLFESRYDQISGKKISIFFENEKINFVKVDSTSSGLYFAYEDKKANGLNIFEGENMIIYFDTAQKVNKVKIEKDPVGKYVPENLISTVNTSLPGFYIRRDKPVKKND